MPSFGFNVIPSRNCITVSFKVSYKIRTSNLSFIRKHKGGKFR